MISYINKEENDISSIFYYIPNFLTKNEESNLYNYLNNTDDFVKNPKYNEGVSRMQKWYQKDKKYFCPQWKERYDQWTSFEMDDTINNMIDKVQNYVHTINKLDVPKINSCLINKYETGENFIASHRDSSISFGEYPTIIGLSVGATRRIDIKHLKNKKNNFSFELESGSIFIMAGSSQKFYYHSINKCDCSNVRYSLTFREFIL